MADVPRKSGGRYLDGERPSPWDKKPGRGGRQTKEDDGFASKVFPVFAVVAPGLESLANFELRRMGIHNPRSEMGGVTFHGTMADVWKVNLWSRIAERVLVRISAFPAEGFGQLESGAARIAWKRWIRPGAKVALSVTCHASKLYHSGAVSQRFEDIIRTAVVGARIIGMAEAEETELDDKAGFGGVVQRVYVRVDSDQCIVSLDSSGMLLHRRGYRQAVTPAPLRETLAAALVLCAGLQDMAPGLARKPDEGKERKEEGDSCSENGEKPFAWLLDPMCGSGTIPLEAARLVCNVAPGCARRFAFQNWPGHDAAAWSALRGEAISRQVPPPAGFVIEGRDVDPKAIEAAQLNERRAKIPCGLVRWSVLPAESTEPREGRGLVVSNPPYGHRIGDEAELRRFFVSFGRRMRQSCPGSRLALLLPDDSGFQEMLGMSSDCRTAFKNGGLPVGVWTGEIPKEKAR